MSAFGQKVAAPVRTYEEEMKFLSRNDATSWTIKPGFVPNMRVEGRFYVNSALEDLVFDELKQQCAAAGHGGFLPAIKQIANVAALPGIVGCSMGMPDLHSGYGEISASRGAAVPSRHRRDAPPSDEAVGGFVFIFEAIRTESSDRDAPRRLHDRRRRGLRL